MNENGLRIMPFDQFYTQEFTKLNYEWLEKYFYIEDYDRKVLENPNDTIIKNGGYIFFALFDHKVVGTVALIKREKDVFELSKMAVTEKMQGKGFGKSIILFCIDFAKEIGVKTLFLDSNTKLKPAIELYKKVGFKEIPVSKDTPYERCNIRMKIDY